VTGDAPNTEYGDRDAVLPNEVLRTVVGSGVHGLAVEGTDDHDEMGVYVEPAATVLGLGRRQDTYTWRTRPEGHRSGPGDTDLVVYSLRHFLRLAVQGNPSLLVPLYAPADAVLIEQPLGAELRGLADRIVSAESGQRYLGYLRGQRERMLGGGKQGRVPNRPELVERYGFDTKYAGHAVRLGLQGVELLERGGLTLPMRPADRDLVLGVRTGRYTLPEVDAMVEALDAQLVRLLARPHGLAVRPEPDREALTRWSVEAHQRHWSA